MRPVPTRSRRPSSLVAADEPAATEGMDVATEVADTVMRVTASDLRTDIPLQARSAEVVPGRAIPGRRAVPVNRPRTIAKFRGSPLGVACERCYTLEFLPIRACIEAPR